MKHTKLVALSAIATAFTVILLSVGAFVPILDYSCIFLAGICIMLPLTQKSVRAALMTYLASALLSLFFIGGRWEITITYAMFFGLHPIFNYFQREKRINRYIALLIKEIWFIGTLVFLYIFFESFIGFEAEWARKYALPLLIVGGGITFIFYDFMMLRFQIVVDAIVRRLKF